MLTSGYLWFLSRKVSPTHLGRAYLCYCQGIDNSYTTTAEVLTSVATANDLG